MDISKKTALIEALLLEDLPDCSEDSDVGVSDEEVEKDLQVPLSRGFDDYFEEAIERVLAEIPPSPTNEEVPSGCSVDQKGKVLNLKKEELLAFIGMNFYMGYNTLPTWTDHYSSASDLNNPLICNTMPSDRFAMILSHLHCNDNAQMPKNCKDKLYKIRPIVDALNKKFQECYHGTREMSVDESMIKFKGRSVLKQYLPMKPIKRGYKLWYLADQRGLNLKMKK
ncbi:unnamed protein product [Parnassius apollo]|uniref:(apollo) hypothetical protein n=1 Tax=Parnassius apollo TaxID=110799 RepID=A0A8S3WBH6_PARAO|nr:unnamed protein product [Parnassius apollo]